LRRPDDEPVPARNLSLVVSRAVHLRDPAGLRELLPRRRDPRPRRSAGRTGLRRLARAARRPCVPRALPAGLARRRAPLPLDRQLTGWLHPEALAAPPARATKLTNLVILLS